MLAASQILEKYLEMGLWILKRYARSDKKTPKAWAIRGLSVAQRSQLGDRYLGRFYERDYFAADNQFQLFYRAGGDYGSHDAGSGLNVDFRQYVAFDDFLDGAFELVTNVDGFNSHDSLPLAVGYRANARFR